MSSRPIVTGLPFPRKSPSPSPNTRETHMNNTTSQVESYVRPERIPERLKRLAPGAVVSHSGLEFECDGYLEDSEWGVFDLTHRVYVHHTYDNFIPLIASKDVSILITRFENLPLFFQVMTTRIARGLY